MRSLPLYSLSSDFSSFFFFNDTATTEIYTLSLHDALPISSRPPWEWTTHGFRPTSRRPAPTPTRHSWPGSPSTVRRPRRSEEHTSELQSRLHLVCRLLLEKKKKRRGPHPRRQPVPHCLRAT